MDSKGLNKILNNTVSYSYGFLDGVEMNQLAFNTVLGEYAVEALGLYIDSKARLNPSALHHVYEWGQAGNKNARLFVLESKATKRNIYISGQFLPSRSISETSTEPFVDKANIMENAIGVTIEPKNSNVLAFEDEGETVFTTQSIYIDNPGGDEVAGSFGMTVEDFFDGYFTNALLIPFIRRLSKPNEFYQYFPSGTKVGNSAGVRAATKYMRAKEVEIQ